LKSYFSKGVLRFRDVIVSAMPVEKWLAEHRKHVMFAILALSIAVRLGYYVELSHGPCLWLYRWDQSDDHFFDRWAKDIAAGDWLTNKELHPVMDWNTEMARMYFGRHPDRVQQFLPGGSPKDEAALSTALWNRWYAGKTFHQEPLYPYAIALTYAVLGPNPQWVFAWQMALGLATTLLWWRLSRRYFGETVGIIAAILIACYAPLYYLELTLVRSALLAFLTAVCVSLADRAFERETPRAWLATGIAFGISMLGQTTLGAFAMACLALILWRYRRQLPVAARFVATAVAGLLIGLSPAIVRNVAVGVPAFSLASNGPLTFIAANDVTATPEWGAFFSFDRVEQVLDQSDAKFLPAAKITVASHPSVWDFAWLMARKFAKFWQWYEEPDNQNLYYFGLYSFVLRWSPTAYLLSPLILAGLVLAASRFERCALLYAIVANGVAVALVASPVGRYRVGFFAAMMPFAAFTLAQAAEWFRARRSGRLMALLAALFVVFLWTSRPLPQGKRVIREIDYFVPFSNYWVPEHSAAAQAGNWPKAASILEDASDHSPADVRQIPSLAILYSQVHAQLADDLSKAGDAARAEREARVALDLATAARGQ
jgi:4-amino-4-deoxy-L-arabinose transferase-like glycosyltransferase